MFTCFLLAIYTKEQYSMYCLVMGDLLMADLELHVATVFEQTLTTSKTLEKV